MTSAKNTRAEITGVGGGWNRIGMRHSKPVELGNQNTNKIGSDPNENTSKVKYVLVFSC